MRILYAAGALHSSKTCDTEHVLNAGRQMAMQGELPDEVVWRRDKTGWAIPEPAWFGTGGPLAPWLARTLAASPFVAESAAAARIDLEHAGLGTRLRLLNLATWHRLFFEESGRPGRALGRKQ